MPYVDRFPFCLPEAFEDDMMWTAIGSDVLVTEVHVATLCRFLSKLPQLH